MGQLAVAPVTEAVAQPIRNYTVWYMAARDESYNDFEPKKLSAKVNKANFSKAQLTDLQVSDNLMTTAF